MKIKTLTITVEGTDRKRHDFERVIRILVNAFSPKKGVYSLKVKEENKKV